MKSYYRVTTTHAVDDYIGQTGEIDHDLTGQLSDDWREFNALKVIF